MDADFSIELGNDDPVLDFPWKDAAAKLSYLDIKGHPELIEQLAEARKFPELKSFLSLVNSSRGALETAKCDAWTTQELNAEEEIYEASCKFACYVDIVFSDAEETAPARLAQFYRRLSFPDHEQFAKKLVDLLRRAPDIPSAAEACVRRCFFDDSRGVQEGFYFTLYLSGYGSDEMVARKNWEVGLRLLGNALLQLSAGR